MSVTTVLGLVPGESVEELCELLNSHGTHPVIWNALCQKYYQTKDLAYNGTVLDLLWPRWQDASIPVFERALLLMTYDHAYVLKRNYARAAHDIQQWLEAHPPHSGRVNHWPALRDFYASDPPYEAIGLWGTSITENMFLDLDAFDEESQEYLPVTKDVLYEVYELVDSVESQD